jgi:hypothetical protein
MPSWLITVLSAAGSVVLTLTVTLLFNKLVALPKELKKQRTAEEAEKARIAREAQEKEDRLRQENCERDAKIAALQAAIDALPSYRQQSLQIQAQLQSTDREILLALTDIKDSMLTNREILNTRLDRLEDREKNAIRAKLIDEYRLFTDETKNPMLAWSEMEHHAFFAMVSDYEDLHGNDYVHNTVIPAMNELRVIKMSDRQALLELMSSRRL